MAQIKHLKKWLFGPFLFTKVRRVFLMIVYFIFIVNGFGQNIIQNGNFESFIIDIRDSSLQYSDWTKLLRYKAPQDKFSEFKKRVENDTSEYPFYSKQELIEYYRPYEGDGAFQSANSGVRSFYQQILNEPLHKDSFYHLQFKYKVKGNNIPKREVEEKANTVIGVVFTKVDFRDSTKVKLLNKSNFNLPWQFHIDNFSFDNNEKWMTYDTFFKASDSYKFVIFGHNDYLTEPSTIRPWKGISYLIDNLLLTKISQNEFENSKKSDKSIISQNPITQFDTLDIMMYKIHQLDTLEIVMNTNLIVNDSVRKYYTFVSKAENCIIDNKNKEALEQYLNAFEYKIPFWRDYFNASHLILKFKIVDSLLLRRFIILANKISDVNYKERIDYLQKFDTSFQVSFMDNFKTDTLFKKLSYKNQIDSALIKSINNLFQRDQSSRNIKKDISNTDLGNYHQILKILNNNEEISESRIGKDGMAHFSIILWHLSRYNDIAWIAPLHKQVMKGNIDNRIFAQLIDSYIDNNIESDPTRSYFLYCLGFPHHDKYIIPLIDRNLIKKADKRRDMIFLESVSDQQRKQLFNYRKGNKDYEFYQFFSHDPIYPGSDISEADALDMQKTFIEQKMNIYHDLIIIDKDGLNYDIDFK